MDEEILLLSLLYYRWKKRMEKKHRKIWVHPIVEKRSERGHFKNLFFEMRKHPEEFFNFMRMSMGSFDELHSKIKCRITKKNTIMRSCIPTEEKLVMTLRYLASGCSLTDLRNNFRVGRSTARVIVKDVCNAIWTCLHDETMPQFSSDSWIEIAKGFERHARFPNCIGAIDGKHIRIKQPFNSGSMYYNFKNYFSTVLFAMCDANYCFTYIEVGSYGKSSDSGIFKNSLLYKSLCDGTLQIPQPRTFENSNEHYPYVIVADDAFPLSENLLKPYRGKHLCPIKQNFNRRLSTARRYIESTFGILTNKWRIFHRPIDVNIDLTESIVKATCVLHNFIRTRDGHQLHNEGDGNDFQLQQISADSFHRGNTRALSARDKFANFFNND